MGVEKYWNKIVWVIIKFLFDIYVYEWSDVDVRKKEGFVFVIGVLVGNLFE